MDFNKINNAKRNMLYGLVNKIVTLICPFIIRSIIIWKLGMEYVGLNSLFTSILQVLSLAELGFGSAIVYSMYEPIAKGDTDGICALLNFYRKVYWIIGTIILTAGLVILPFIGKMISGDHPADVNIYFLYGVYLLNTIVSYFLSAYKQSLLLAHQRTDIEMKISTAVYVGMYVAQILCLFLVRNYYWYVIWVPAATIGINIVRSRQVRKMYPDYKGCGSIAANVRKDMYKRVFGLMLTRICQVCRNSFDSIIISAFLGLVILGQYQNYYYIMNSIIGFLAIVTSSIVAGIGNNIVTKTVVENYKQLKVFLLAYNWLASWCAICMLCLYQPFMKIWVGEENMFPFILVILMCIYFYSLKIGDVVAVYKEATGIYWEDKARPIVESIANLVLNVALVKYIGVYGVVLSTIISIVFINIPWSAYSLFKAYFKTGFWNYMKEICCKFALLVLVGALTYYGCSLLPSEGYGAFFCKIINCVIVPNVIYLLVYARTPEFAKFKQMVLKK